jgi:hypothetical protein
VFAQAINWFPDSSEALGLFTEIPIKICKYEILIKTMKWQSQRLIQSKIVSQKFEDLTWICDLDRISGATYKDMTTKTHNVATPEVCSGKNP